MINRTLAARWKDLYVNVALVSTSNTYQGWNQSLLHSAINKSSGNSIKQVIIAIMHSNSKCYKYAIMVVCRIGVTTGNRMGLSTSLCCSVGVQSLYG